jgi:hypothetical protein
VELVYLGVISVGSLKKKKKDSGTKPATPTTPTHSGSKYLKSWPKFKIAKFTEMPDTPYSVRIQTLDFFERL